MARTDRCCSLGGFVPISRRILLWSWVLGSMEDYEMTPCPLCWLRVHGFPGITETHTLNEWMWLREHKDDTKVREALDNLPSGIVEEESETRN